MRDHKHVICDKRKNEYSVGFTPCCVCIKCEDCQKPMESKASWEERLAELVFKEGIVYLKPYYPHHPASAVVDIHRELVPFIKTVVAEAIEQDRKEREV